MKSETGEVCILAGGLSSRMGRDKSRMRLAGKTMIEHVQKVAHELGWPVRVIRRDLAPRCGPLGGVYTALQTSAADSFLFLACDMPFVRGSFILDLIKQFDSKVDAVFTQDCGRVGFPFLLRRSVLRQIEQQIVLRQFSLEQLARDCGAKRMSSPPRPAEMLLNINCPEDWRLARQLAREAGRLSRPNQTSKGKLQKSLKLRTSTK